MLTRRTIFGAAVAAAALGVSTLAAAPAQAAPIMQLPVLGVQFSGLVVPAPMIIDVHAQPAGAGQTRFSAPGHPTTCSSTATSILIQIDYTNPTAGRSGSATVKPCPYFNWNAPTSVVRDTGYGQVFTTARVITTYQPTAGQPALPGVGTFTR